MNNPLSDYYRTKEIYVKLPTNGYWYKQELHLTDQHEIGVMPMSFKDEMLLQVPDSVYNGESLFEILRSIVPDLEDPYEICMPDVDVLLLASRINSNEGEIPATATCPHCENVEQYSLKITNLLNRLTTIEPIEQQLANGLTVVFKPNTLRSVTANQIKITENTKMLMQLQNAEVENKQDLMKESLERSTAANMLLLADTIVSVTTPKGETITDLNTILDWLANSDSKTIKALQKTSVQMNMNGLEKEFKFDCSNEQCGKSFESSVEFNPTFFFTNK